MKITRCVYIWLTGFFLLGSACSALSAETPKPQSPVWYRKEADWTATLLASRAALQSAALAPEEFAKAQSAIWAAVAVDYPLEWDWVLQDYGTEFAVWFGMGTRTDCEQKMLQAVLAELGAEDTTFKTEFDQLAQSKAPLPQQWLQLYQRACQERRARRLQPLLKTAPGIVFTKHRTIRPSFFGYTEGASDARAERHFLNGSALCLWEMDGTTGKVRTLLEDPTGFIRDPSVSYDGRRVLFAWKKDLNQDDYHLYEMEMASGRIRQLTFGLGYADYEASYLPNDDIVFASTRSGQSVDCWWTEVSNLFTCDKDGRFLRRLGFDQVHTLYPTVTHDGRVIYTRWDYSDRGQVYTQPLFQMRPDGTGQEALYGGNSWFPTTIAHARGIPQTGKVVAILCGHHTPQTGKLAIIDPAKGREENIGVQLIAPVRETKAERIDKYGQTGELFQYPYALTERDFLVSYSPLGWNEQHQADFHLYYMDIDGRRELLASDPTLPCNQPFPLVARQKPALRPSMVDYHKTTGSYYVQDVYVGPGLAGVPRGTIKHLRAVALELRAAGIGNNNSQGPGGSALCSTPVAVGNGTWDVKRVLGDAKVYEDGSAFFTVPARTPIYFQALDENNRVVQTMRSWSTLQPGENQSCIGCHEDKNTAPPSTYAQSQALRAGAQELQPFYGPTRGFSFIKEIQPILNQHCISCHNDRKLPGALAGTSATQPPANKAFSLLGELVEDIQARRHWSDAYLALTGATRLDPKRAYAGQTTKELVNWVGAQSIPAMLPPYFAGSNKSKLVTMLEQGHQNVKLSREELDKISCWIDLLVPFSGDYTEATAWSEDEAKKYDYYLAKRHRMEKIERENIQRYLRNLAGEKAQNTDISIELQDRAGTIIARQEAHGGCVELFLTREYQYGDRVAITGAEHLAIRLDAAEREVLVHAPSGRLEFPIPSGKQLLYPAECFTGHRHNIAARIATAEELAAYRNVALNPYAPGAGSPPTFYPYASSNSECRNDPAFAARNAIDGKVENKKHGSWPYQSWGPDQRTDLWWKVDFGRPVQVDKLVLLARADFPHDSVWSQATIRFSDGSTETITLKPVAEPQTFTFNPRQATWVELVDLVAPKKARWCALSEVEIYGNDSAPRQEPRTARR